jgi:hypothetical protein
VLSRLIMLRVSWFDFSAFFKPPALALLRSVVSCIVALGPKLGPSVVPPGARRPVMAEDPIPQNLQDAFRDVVHLYSDWSPALPDREISIDGKPFSMSTVCGFVSGFDDQLPEDLFEVLSSYMHTQDQDLQEELAVHESYASGGRCLRKLMERRRDAYRQREEALRARE